MIVFPHYKKIRLLRSSTQFNFIIDPVCTCVRVTTFFSVMSFEEKLMMRQLFLCLGFVVCTSCCDFSYSDYKNVQFFKRLAGSHHVDFDVSMRADQDHQFMYNDRALNVIDCFRKLYKKRRYLFG